MNHFRSSTGIVVTFISSAWGIADYNTCSRNLPASRVHHNIKEKAVYTSYPEPGDEERMIAVCEYLEKQRLEFIEYCKKNNMEQPA